MKEEREGRISELVYYNEQNFYAILLFETKEEQFFAVGNLPNPRTGRRYRLTGDWYTHPKYGEQFKFSSAEELEPTSEDGIVSFLASGMIRGIGKSTAESIVRVFGADTLRVIREEPGKLLSVPGIGEKKAEAIAAGYAEHREYAETVLALSAFDISTNVCLKLYRAFGSDAVNVIRDNPYTLIDEIYGIGFKKADKIAESVGIEKNSPFRIQSAVIYLLGELAGRGSTYAPETEFIEHCAEYLDVSRDEVGEACFNLTMDGRLSEENLDGETVLMLQHFARAEKTVAAKLYELCNSVLPALSVKPENYIKAAEKKGGPVLSEKQKNAVLSSLRSGVSVITGGPGTGKTTIINTILTILDAAGLKTALAAPTGRAAKRMQAATDTPATTVHRLLEYAYAEGEDRMIFGKNRENPLEQDCIIIDEVSMVDLLLMEALMNAVKAGTRLILVGDADQLPPVGAGNVLADILSCDMINASRLTEIFRQAGESAIVVNAHAINHGEYPCCNEKGSDFFLVRAGRDDEIAKNISELVTKRLPGFYTDIDPYTDIQVLTPTRKGPLGSTELNRMLQQVLNPAAPEKPEKTIGERTFRKGDKVMQIKNNYQMEWKNLNSFVTSTGIFNGDMGIVDSVDNDRGTVGVVFDDDKYVTYDYSNIDELEHAFALTVHKSQGSEFPVVVMPMTHFPPMLSTRNLLYTAITRARQGVVLVGDQRYANAMVDNNSSEKRYSGLGTRLRNIWAVRE